MFTVTAYVNIAIRQTKNRRSGFRVAPVNDRSNISKPKVLWIFSLTMLALAATANATTIVAIRSFFTDKIPREDFIVIAVDSRVMVWPSGAGPRQPRADTDCKIRQFGSVVVALAGIIGDPVWQAAAESVEEGGTLKQIADRWQVKIGQIPIPFERMPPKDRILVGTFAKIEDGTPKVAARGITVNITGGKVNVVGLRPQNCPGDCPTGYGTLHVGASDAARKLERDPDFRKIKNMNEAAAKLVQAEIDASSDNTVGGRIGGARRGCKAKPPGGEGTEPWEGTSSR